MALSRYLHAAAAAKSLQSCLTLCDPTDSSPPDSSVPGILQARILEWVAISFSTIPAWSWRNLILLSTFHPQLPHGFYNLCILSVIRRLIHLHKRNWESHRIWFLPVSIFSVFWSRSINKCCASVIVQYFPLIIPLSCILKPWLQWTVNVCIISSHPLWFNQGNQGLC